MTARRTRKGTTTSIGLIEVAEMRKKCFVCGDFFEYEAGEDDVKIFVCGEC